VLKRAIQALLIGYVVPGLATRGLEEVGLFARREMRPRLPVQGARPFRVSMGIPRGHVRTVAKDFARPTSDLSGIRGKGRRYVIKAARQ
jgi:hypothetical protein